MANFVSFLLDGVKADGTKTTLPLLTNSSMGDYLWKPYKEWAIEPHKSLPAAAMMGFPMNIPSPPPMIRIGQAFGGMNELMNQIMRLSLETDELEISSISMKNRVSFLSRFLSIS
jgi:hypothetical protein